MTVISIAIMCSSAFSLLPAHPVQNASATMLHHHHYTVFGGKVEFEFGG